MQRLSIYIHIPFCIRKCFYCDFLSFSPNGQDETARYFEALLEEIEQESTKYEGYLVDTVFFGGGTPSSVDAVWMKQVMEKLKQVFAFTDRPEISIEVNPGSADAQKFQVYLESGINRLSIGMQSVRDDELKRLGRIHCAEDFFSTYASARQEGFVNINADMMFALPDQSLQDYRDTLLAVSALRPEHISAYSLIIEEGTPFYSKYGPDIYADGPVSEEDDRNMDRETEQILAGCGYKRYEISNYAIEGFECRHNQTYWKRYDYAGFGLGASSMANNVRWKNTAVMSEYLKIKQHSVKEDIHSLPQEEQMEEFMFLGLRLTEGVDREEFVKLFHRSVDEVYGLLIKKLQMQKLLETGKRIRLTPYGRDISNYVMAQFLLCNKKI